MMDRLSAHYWLNEKTYAAASSDAVIARRREALERFEAMGFPTKRDEEWKYTSIKGLLKPAYKLVSPFASEDSDEHIEFKDIKQYMVNDIDC